MARSHVKMSERPARLSRMLKFDGVEGDWRNAIELNSQSLAGKKFSTSAWIKADTQPVSVPSLPVDEERNFSAQRPNPLVGFSLSETHRETTGYKKARYSRAKSQPGL
jgi:hypothetical protein